MSLPLSNGTNLQTLESNRNDYLYSIAVLQDQKQLQGNEIDAYLHAISFATYRKTLFYASVPTSVS